MDLDEIIERLYNFEFIQPEEIFFVCDIAIEVLQSEKNVLYVNSPLIVCGDVHGDFKNLREIFDIFERPPDGRYLFLGDYVDRGDNSVETILLLLCLKIKYPDDVYLIRGNHESPTLTITFGFYTEIMRRYSNYSIWQCFIEVFKYLPLAAVIDSQYFCVHGGLCPLLKSVSDIEKAERFVAMTTMAGVISDILWSDPYEGLGYSISPRQAGYLWGSDISHHFLHENKLSLIIRGHEKKDGGFAICHDDLVMTVFSTPYYSKLYREAAVLEISSPTEKELTRFRAMQWEHSLEKVVFPDQWS
ncbi:serine/threonine-protein phosphatase 2A catalytic subunit alpha isoform [Histomonas meleagridis]|uniref:serine/threonine-protein phosphatase 2A catalytic subunit alpha isoform n=1 Tax=Histomonas meleagridis TaxID=135588 RepID=UPI003559CDA8|nr:serine/threonine-protein phosphatase 2A catalytic subunit alpha isoform [Histomonas meleagridis]KAH0802817.1 serine/threonine-protein phosphatase 2A catalytic subunit alpha isoform [Histomonas meleagridis]